MLHDDGEDAGDEEGDEDLGGILPRAIAASVLRHHEGTGLGLALSHGLAVAMGGSIACESTVGRGTRFVVELPLADAVGEN